MTGFGVSNLETENMNIQVEVRSINSKSQDFSIRLPRRFQEKEYELKTILTQLLDRGKVSIQVEIVGKGKVKPKLTINPDIFKAYAEDLKLNAEAAQLDCSNLLNAVLTLPEVFDTEKQESQTDNSWNEVLNCIQIAILGCDNFRKDEGEKLQIQIQNCLAIIEDRLNKIAEKDSDRLLKIRDKIKSKLEEFLPSDKIDTNRFEQELIYYIEKLDISEEKVRLKTHIDYFLETMNSKEANGKKLGFITQEIGREINTIGSKANDANIQKWVVEMKDELEKIKEQSMNIL